MEIIKFKVLSVEENEVQLWTLKEIISRINENRSGGWTDYDESDWEEGWKEWVETEGYYKLIGS